MLTLRTLLRLPPPRSSVPPTMTSVHPRSSDPPLSCVIPPDGTNRSAWARGAKNNAETSDSCIATRCECRKKLDRTCAPSICQTCRRHKLPGRSANIRRRLKLFRPARQYLAIHDEVIHRKPCPAPFCASAPERDNSNTQASLRRTMSLTCAGLALPCEAFIT